MFRLVSLKEENAINQRAYFLFGKCMRYFEKSKLFLITRNADFLPSATVLDKKISFLKLTSSLFLMAIIAHG